MLQNQVKRDKINIVGQELDNLQIAQHIAHLVPDGATLRLPAGVSLLEFGRREDGARVDRLFLTADPKQSPE